MTLEEVFANQKKYALAGQSKNITFRIQQLKKLKSLIKNHENDLMRALALDLNKSVFESYLTEFSIIYHELELAVKKIKKWSKIKKKPNSLITWPAKNYLLAEPYGTVLIMGAWNYPYQLLLVPLISAIAAGNTVILKPSELSENCSRLITKLLNNNFNPEFLFCCEGSAEVSQALLQLSFDKIFFTGSSTIGKLVAQCAANNLIPCTLELGGKSPCVVMADSDIAASAKKIVWGKFLNAGQTCIAPDYVMVENSVYDSLIQELKFYIIKFFGENPENNLNFPKIINNFHYQRLRNLIDTNKVLLGNQFDSDKNYISPTLLGNIDFKDKIMQEEVFGPLLPVLKFENCDECIDKIHSLDKPLAFYLFTKNKHVENKFLSAISFGSACVNDVVIQIGNTNLPFGGIGKSGIGNYHGEYGFRCFSHFKSIVKKHSLDFPLRYPPYRKWKMKLLRLFYH